MKLYFYKTFKVHANIKLSYILIEGLVNQAILNVAILLKDINSTEIKLIN